MLDFPKRGHGQSRRLAEHLGVAPIIISQILSGGRDFTADQAMKVAEFFLMDERTTEYFLYQVSSARADSKKLKAFYEEKMAQMRAESQNIKNVVIPGENLKEEDRIEFYSNWYYAAIWLLSSIEGYQTVEAIAEYFSLSRVKVNDVTQFLLRVGLCFEEHGKIKMGPKSVFVDDKNFQINNHRRSWRDMAIHRFSEPKEDELFFSCPVSISKTDAEKFRKVILSVIQDFSKNVGPSKPETLFCLNIDWFHF